jgi:hypothetical protein
MINFSIKVLSFQHLNTLGEILYDLDRNLHRGISPIINLKQGKSVDPLLIDLYKVIYS